MTMIVFLLILTITTALIFDFINGFHDAANSIATVVSTRVLKPYVAVLWAAFFNFIAMFIFFPKVAETISKIVHIESNDPLYIYVVFSGLIGAIIWDLLTWYFGLPTSSSHALVGGIAGAGVAHAGFNALNWNTLIVILEFIVLAPIIGYVLGSFFIFITYWYFRRCPSAFIDRFFRKAQLLSAAMYSLGHGANDAQKTMGIIMAVLLAGGIISEDTRLSLGNPQTSWIILSCQLAMAVGTAIGGWRIVKTLGMKITRLKPIGGFCAESAGAFTIFFATYFGIPISTTHTITGSIIGVGSMVRPLTSVQWLIALKIMWAWVLTIPASAIIATVCLYSCKLLLDI